MHIIVVGLALFVAWGRARRAPIASAEEAWVAEIERRAGRVLADPDASVITSKPAIRDRLKTGHTGSDRDRFI